MLHKSINGLALGITIILAVPVAIPLVVIFWPLVAAVWACNRVTEEHGHWPLEYWWELPLKVLGFIGGILANSTWMYWGMTVLERLEIIRWCD